MLLLVVNQSSPEQHLLQQLVYLTQKLSIYPSVSDLWRAAILKSQQRWRIK